ncbi:DUF6278 family protein [Arthrobacter oryzae]|jgi:hypothetical protein|uniref:DUF6278 family protein n=1 Tax=Arthrobacter oryzae TaxID=409290 RepID=UPI002787FB83|nr:DUF6278 family protein [Arthrobacter oryzae]MDQ0079110.1 hypothetical protein [Arthrobacter oryzae]
MNDSDDSVEPLQSLPPGMAWRYAEYMPADPDAVFSPVTNVGGYDDLLEYFQARGLNLPRSEDGLAAIDELINATSDKESLADLARPIGMFYGDVITHTIPGAHWEVIREEYPRVRITTKSAVDVVRVALGRLSAAEPTLLQNYFHVREAVEKSG